jgi:hypothetical protein
VYRVLALVTPAAGRDLIVIVPLLVLADPLVGTRAAWLTRPLSPWRLLVSKAAFVGLVLVAPPLALEIVLLAVNGVTLPDVALAAAEVVFRQLTLILAVASLAALTSDFARFAAWAAAAFAVGTAAWLYLDLAALLTHPFSVVGASGEPALRAREILPSAVVIVSGRFSSPA